MTTIQQLRYLQLGACLLFLAEYPLAFVSERHHHSAATPLHFSPSKPKTVQQRLNSPQSTKLQASFLDALFKPPSNTPKKKTSSSSVTSQAVQTFIDGWNSGEFDRALSTLTTDCVFDSATFFNPCEGQDALERRLRLLRQAQPDQVVVLDQVTADERAVGIKFHWENDQGRVPLSRGSAFFVFDSQQEIENVLWVQETDNKAGETGLKILQGASQIIEKTGVNPAKDKSNKEQVGSTTATTTTTSVSKCAPLEYFEAWSRRDMKAAVNVFADDVIYDDTAFPQPFSGKQALEDHLLLCAECFPDSFTFQVEDYVDSGDTVCVKWHVENDGEQMPFTRGCSVYEINRNGKIQSGLDFIEPAVFKPGGTKLFVDTVKNQVRQEPARLVPIAVWVAYIVIVFFSNGILPGADATQLEERTWNEVLDLSLNFFLVSPILGLPFSPEVHPMLEGVFNLLLSWAAMFAGFLSDDRKDKPNVLPMLPMVVGMQFLTSAFLLPYLAVRSTETRNDVSKRDLSVAAKACESPLLGITMGGVGSLSIGWAFLGRQASFVDLTERWHTFLDLLSIDRVGSSFLVDLAIFGLFQFWLIDDDMKRREVSDSEYSSLVTAAKYVPFFGMAAYLVLRPPLPSDEEFESQ